MTTTVIGIDAGGSYLRVTTLTGDRAPHTCETTKVNSVPADQYGWPAAIAHLEATIAGALAHVAADSPPSAIVAGIAGAGAETNRDRWTDALSHRYPATEIRVVPDHTLLLTSAGNARSTVGAIVGTGLVVAARRSPDEPPVTVDGWGPVFGDNGSAFSIGRAAIAAALADLDGRGPTTKLRTQVELVLGLAGIEEAPGLLGSPARVQVGRIASLAPCVLSLDLDGDAVATSIVDNAVGQVAHAVRAAVTRIGATDYELLLAGGVLDSSRFRESLVSSLDQLECAPAEVNLRTELSVVAAHTASRVARSGVTNE